MDRIGKDISLKLPARTQKLMGCAADYLENEQWEITLTLLTTILEEVENAFGSDSLHVGVFLSIVGFINTKVDKYDEAESVLKRAIPIVERYDKELLLAATIYRYLGDSYVKMKRYEEAEIYSRKALEIYEKLDKTDALLLAHQKALIGDLCLQLKKPDEAKQFLRVAFPVVARKYGIGSVEVKGLCKLLERVYRGNTINDCLESLRNSNEIADVIPLCLLGMRHICKNFPEGTFFYYLHAVKIYESNGFLDESQMDKIYFTLGECFLKIRNYMKVELFYSNKSGASYQEVLTAIDLMIFDVTIRRAVGIFFEKSLTKDNEKSGKPRFPILKAKCNAVVSTFKILFATVRRRW